MAKIKFPKKLRTRWIKALESGRYKQTTLKLEDAGKHCCLGVLGRILRIDRSQLCTYSLPAALDGYEKFPKSICTVGNHNTRFAVKLAKLNDSGKSFKEIAQYIKEKTIGV